MSCGEQDPLRVTLVKNGILLEVQAVGLEGEEAPPADANDCGAGTARRALDFGERRWNHSEVPFAEQAGALKEPTLEATVGDEKRPSSQVADHKLPLEPVANSGGSTEGPLVEGISIGAEDQGHGPKAVIEEHGHLAQIVAKWEMLNPANHCFANAYIAFISPLHDWGVLQAGLKAMVQSGSILSSSGITLPNGTGLDSVMLLNLQPSFSPRWTRQWFDCAQ